MNRTPIIELAGSVWNNVILVNENVAKGELKVNGQYPAGICFLDMQNEVRFDDFSDYQEKLLADEYYNSPGPLQWNFYLFLLRDNIDLQTKYNIERDDKYARKYVLNEEEFKEFFKLEKSSVEPIGNIVDEWKKKLDAVGLHNVYNSKVPYTVGVDAFCNEGNSIVRAEKYHPSTPIVSQIETRLDYINKIKLCDNYREYPKTKEYSFGKVNLIKGANGVGKTSLLEAIELIACGKTYRNSSAGDEDNCVEADINEGVREICEPTNYDKYRGRDSFWYGNNNIRDNRTANSFNRFNFFNTDAAKDFIASNKEKEIKKSLYNLVFGAEYSLIMDRMSGYAERIQSKYNRLSKERYEADQKIKAASEKIEKLKNSGTTQGLKEIIHKDISKLQFLDKNMSIEHTTSTVNQLKTLVEELLHSDHKAIQSYIDLSDRKSVLQAQKEKFSEFRINFTQLNRYIDTKQKILNGLIKKNQLLSDALIYFNDTRAFSIRELTDRIEANSKGLNRLRAVKDAIYSIDLRQYSSSLTLDAFLRENTEQLVTARAELEKIDLAVHKSLQKFSQIEKIISQIKSLGKEYISIDTDAHICPLCQSSFAKDDLIIRIDSIITDSLGESSGNSDLIAEKNILKEKVELYEKYQSQINSLRSAYAIISGQTAGNLPLETLINVIQTTISDEDALLSVKAELDGINEWLTSCGLSYEEFSDIEKRIIDLSEPQLIFLPDKKDVFLAYQRQTKSSIEDIKKEIEALIEVRNQLISQLKTDLELSPDKEYRPSAIDYNLISEEKTLDFYENIFRKIREIIILGDDSRLENIKLQLSLLEKNLSSLKIEIQSQFEVRNAEKEKKDAEEFIAKTQTKFERIESGYNLLTQLSNTNGIDYLSHFLEQNVKEINDIFRTIHSPREFKSVKFIDQELLLFKDNDQVRKITQISTGQRAALAISLFISLNRKLKNGPNIILFDDPVSHVDDLNALSFLDFLRLFMLKDNKQIFIATANARLASLIEKKFSFLGEDFKQWELER